MLNEDTVTVWSIKCDDPRDERDCAMYSTSTPDGVTKAFDIAKAEGWKIEGNGGPHLCPACQ
jgi:hypothetical protein